MAVIACSDLMFGVRVQNAARAAGLHPLTYRAGMDLANAAVMIVNLGENGDWESAIRRGADMGVRVVAFGPHMDAEARKRARRAGAGRVLANSNLARDLPAVLREAAEMSPGSDKHEGS